MSTIAAFTIPAESFPLGSVFTHCPKATIELERIVPTNYGIIPYIWIRGIDDVEAAGIATALQHHAEVKSVELLDELGEDYLLRVEWEPAYTGLLEAIAQTPVVLQSGSGNSERWTFEIRGDRQENIATFQEYCRDHDFPIQLTSLHALARIGINTEYELTDTQREALVLAFQRGYYRTPRETTLQEMADTLDITGQAFGARLRGGIHHLIGSTLIEASDDT